MRISQIGRTHGGAVPDFVKVCNFPSKTSYLAPRLCLAKANGGFRGERNCIKVGDGLIIVDHGSRRKESNLMLSKLPFSNKFVFFNLQLVIDRLVLTIW